MAHGGHASHSVAVDQRTTLCLQFSSSFFLWFRGPNSVRQVCMQVLFPAKSTFGPIAVLLITEVNFNKEKNQNL